jgi:hypothetical protein
MPAQRRGNHQRSRQHPNRHPGAGARPGSLPLRPGSQDGNQEQQQQDAHRPDLAEARPRGLGEQGGVQGPAERQARGGRPVQQQPGQRAEQCRPPGDPKQPPGSPSTCRVSRQAGVGRRATATKPAPPSNTSRPVKTTRRSTAMRAPTSVPSSAASSAMAGGSRVAGTGSRLGFRHPTQGRGQPVGDGLQPDRDAVVGLAGANIRSSGGSANPPRAAPRTGPTARSNTARTLDLIALPVALYTLVGASDHEHLLATWLAWFGSRWTPVPERHWR